MDQPVLQEVKRLAEQLKKVATELNVASEVLATRKDLEAIAAGRRVDQVLSGWRKELLNEALSS